LVITSAYTGPALATGFTPADLEAAARTTQTINQQAQAVAIREQSEALRIGLATETGASLAKLNEGERAALAASFGALDERRSVQIAWFMAGAIAQSTTDGVLETRLYNPLAQLWLTMGWTIQEGGRPQLSRVVAMSAQGVPDWTTATGSYLAAFAASYSAANPQNGVAATPETMFVEADRWIGGLANWALIPTRNAALTRISQTIRDGEAGRYGAAGATLDALPRLVRASFAPITGFNRTAQDGDGGRGAGSVLLVSPLYPNLIIAADFDATPGPNLQNLTLINLSNARVGAR
jgi:hypothetical protein